MVRTDGRLVTRAVYGTGLRKRGFVPPPETALQTLKLRNQQRYLNLVKKISVK